MWFLIPVEKWNFILFAVLYLKEMDEELRFLPNQYRLCPKKERNIPFVAQFRSLLCGP